MYPNYPSESESVLVTKTNGGFVTLTCKEPLENCLVVIHSADIEEPLTIAHANGSNPRVCLKLNRSGEFNLVVFTWAVSDSFLSSSVSLVQSFSKFLSVPLFVEYHTVITN